MGFNSAFKGLTVNRTASQKTIKTKSVWRSGCTAGLLVTLGTIWRSGIIFTLRSSYPRKGSPVHIECEAEWNIRLVWLLTRRKNVLSLPEIEPRFQGRTVRGPVTNTDTPPPYKKWVVKTPIVFSRESQNALTSSLYSQLSVPIPVATRSKTWVCGCSLAGIVGSSPARGMDVCLLWVLCVVR